MMKTAIGTLDSDSFLISLSLKPRRNWPSYIMAIVSLCMASLGIVAIVIQWTVYEISESLYLKGLISEAPTDQYDVFMIALVLLMAFMGVNETTKATKSFWLTKDLNKDISTKGVVILKPISKSDLD